MKGLTHSKMEAVQNFLSLFTKFICEIEMLMKVNQKYFANQI